MRLDQYIKDKYKISRHKAQQMILAGHIEVNAKLVTKPAHMVESGDEVLLKDEDFLRYVSRAGLKLEKAMQALEISPKGKLCLDLGQSTGGFSDCLLQKGAKKVIGIDVGHGQLDSNLQDKPGLISIEGKNIKDFHRKDLMELTSNEEVDLMLSDLSFISSLDLMPHMNSLIGKGSHILMLIKPQFELGAENLNKKGLVKDAKLYDSVKAKAKKSGQQLGWQVLDYIPSSIKGSDGNQEFFLYAKK